MKKQFLITPTVSVGEIMLGMDRDDVRGILLDYSEYKNQHDDGNTADCFEICQVFYNDENKAEFIMFHALDEVELLWGESLLTDMTKDQLVCFFSALDPDIFVEDYGYGIISIESNRLGVACYFVKDIETDESGNDVEVDKVETISVAVKDYWKDA